MKPECLFTGNISNELYPRNYIQGIKQSKLNGKKKLSMGHKLNYPILCGGCQCSMRRFQYDK